MPAPYLPQPIAGVYVIVCTANQRGYIGQGRDVGKRLTIEHNQLSTGVHHNAELQRDWGLYGPHSFAFKILDRDLPDESARLDREHERITRAIDQGRSLYNRNLDRDDGRDWQRP